MSPALRTRKQRSPYARSNTSLQAMFGRKGRLILRVLKSHHWHHQPQRVLLYRSCSIASGKPIPELQIAVASPEKAVANARLPERVQSRHLRRQVRLLHSSRPQETTYCYMNSDRQALAGLKGPPIAAGGQAQMAGSLLCPISREDARLSAARQAAFISSP